MEENYVVIKVLNNNVILVNHAGTEKILYKKGLGFGKRLGDTIDHSTLIEKVFSIENADNSSNFIKPAQNVDTSLSALSEKIIHIILNVINENLNITIDKKSLDYAQFAEHIKFAIERIQINNPIKNELLLSIKRKYKQSYSIAKKSIDLIKNQLNINITDDEAGYITLYIERFKSLG